ncbi:MAG TPA: FAD-binding oxidoreductase [Acidimicrobiia bacterium]|nr:FAD-binding oxidoreductase [Acidimicrobiia bacterium]
MHSPSTTNELSIRELREALDGEVITPDDHSYDEARHVFYGIDRRPAVIIRPTNADEVAYVVSVARDSGAELAIRSGGHSIAGYGSSDGGITLDLSEMKSVRVDSEHRTAWAQTGLTAGELTTELGKYGLAVGFGDTGSVGIGGITLGGGVGFLSRKFGLTIDSLLAAELVTADGKVLQVDTESHPDLFWAIRGGSGNFGVATSFQYRLHEVDQMVGGMLILPATPETIAGFVELADSAPDELSTIANVMKAPPMPFLPEELHGQVILFTLLVYAGDPETGEEVIAPFRELARPLSDMVEPGPYAAIYEDEEEGPPPGVFAVRNLFVDKIDRAAAETIIEHVTASTAAMAVAQIRVLGGAIAQVPEETTAYAHRREPIMLNIASMFEQPDEAATHQVWVDRLATALGDKGTAYVNFIGDEGESRVRQAYPGQTWERLRQVKQRYDPTNLFRVNQNIPPAGD